MEHSCSQEGRNRGSYGSLRLWMDGDLGTSLLGHMWCLSVCCGQDRESHMNRAKIQARTFFLFFFFHETGKILQNFLKQISQESSSHIVTPWLCLQICGVSSSGTTCLLITSVERARKAWGHRDTLPGNGDAPSRLVWRKTAACQGLEMHSNYFQALWASQHPQSIFHLHLVSQVIVAEEKSKPNVSNLSGLPSPSAVWKDAGMVAVHRTGFAQLHAAGPLSKRPKPSQFPLE